MRVGKNPLRDAKVDGFPLVIMAAITHLPDLKGYHEKRLDIVKLSLISMREAAGMDAKTMVWDNGSCPELIEWLQDEYQPDFLITSGNIGKINARTAMINMLPDNTVLAVTDDDMFFYQDWLKEAYKILRYFPNVGAVSCYPTRKGFSWATIKTIDWARNCEDAELEIGKFIPEEWEHDYAMGLGRDWKFHQMYSAKDMDYLVTYKGKYKAFLTAHHCQWMGYAGRLKPLVIYDDFAMANDRPFDEKIDGAGLLRLTTIERYARHMGNIPDKDLFDYARELKYI